MMGAPSALLVIAVLGGIVALVLISRRVLLMLPARFGAGGMMARGGMLAVEQTIALDARRRVVLLRCGERRIILLTGGAQDVVVGWLPDQPGGPA